MVRADLCVLIDFKYISFLATNSKMPSFFEAQIPWKLQAGDFLLVFSPVQLFGTQWDTRILRHFQEFAPCTSSSHFYYTTRSNQPEFLIFRHKSLLGFRTVC